MLSRESQLENLISEAKEQILKASIANKMALEDRFSDGLLMAHEILSELYSKHRSRCLAESRSDARRAASV